MPRDYALKGTASWAKEKPEKAGEEHVLKVGIVITEAVNYFCSFYSDPSIAPPSSRLFVGFWPQ